MYLRPYQAEDLNALYALDLLCFEPRFRFSRGMMRSVVSAANAVARLVCEADELRGETILGFCVVTVESYRGNSLAYVATLDVDPEYRREGLGRVLMLALEDEVARAGVCWMALHVYVENNAALRLYEGLGYTQVRRERDFYGSRYDAWFYRKQLIQR